MNQFLYDYGNDEEAKAGIVEGSFSGLLTKFKINEPWPEP
jgi:hypothetical protein